MLGKDSTDNQVFLVGLVYEWEEKHVVMKRVLDRNGQTTPFDSFSDYTSFSCSTLFN